jgi:hypothetical protein
MTKPIILKKKPVQSFANSTQNVFRLLSYPDSKVDVMGTSSLRFRYVSDIDLFDVIYIHTDKEKFRTQAVNFFQELIKKIRVENDLYFIDFIATMENDEPKHWTKQEIVSNNFDSLFDHQNVIKIDIAQYTGGRFLAVSNWYEFRYGNGRGINQEKETRDSPKSLREDMKKIYYMKKNYMKVLKRLFIIATNDKNDKLVKKLTEIFESDLGKLYKIKSELDTMVSVLEVYHDKQTVDRVKSALQLLKQDCSTTGFQFQKSFYDKFDKLQTYKTYRSLNPKMKKIKEYLLTLINKEVMKKIK